MSVNSNWSLGFKREFEKKKSWLNVYLFLNDKKFTEIWTEMGKDCTTCILFLCVVNSEGMAGYCSTKKVLYDLYKAIPFLAALCFLWILLQKLLLTLHQFNISTLVLGWVWFSVDRLFMALFVFFTGLALLVSLVSDLAMRALAKNSLHPQGINLHY